MIAPLPKPECGHWFIRDDCVECQAASSPRSSTEGPSGRPGTPASGALPPRPLRSPDTPQANRADDPPHWVPLGSDTFALDNEQRLLLRHAISVALKNRSSEFTPAGRERLLVLSELLAAGVEQ